MLTGAYTDVWGAAWLGAAPLVWMINKDKTLVDAINMVPSVEVFLVSLAMSAPYLMYAFIWYFPKGWKAICSVPPFSLLGKHPVDVFSFMCLFLKSVQLTTLLAWWTSVHDVPLEPASTLELLKNSSTESWVALAVAMAVSQVFNAAIYAQIGNDGVYYGFKLGRPVPWAYGFPFNVGMRHPQYFGALLGFWALTYPLLTPEALQAGLLPLMLLISSMYTLVALYEEGGNEEKSD